MLKLEVSLLGTPVILIEGRAFETDRRKAIALLAYLIVTGVPQPREHLAAFFWPGYDRESAFAYLRRTLYELNKGLGSERLLSDRQGVWIDLSREATVDVRDIERSLAAARFAEDQLPHLEAAAAQVRGEFLAGFILANTDPFAQWLRRQRESYRRQHASILERLVTLNEQRGAWELALKYAQDWLVLEDTEEAAHRAVMRAYAGIGERNRALQQYEYCVQALKREIGVRPQPETTEVYESIHQGSFEPSVRTQPRSPEGASAPEVMLRDSSVFTASLADEDQARFIELIASARSLQAENPLYEPVYRQLVHRYVLNGSRLNLLKIIDRRLRGLVEGQGALLLISGISGSGKTSLVTALQGRMAQLGATFIPVPCFEQERTAYALWLNTAYAVATAIGVPTDTLSAPIGTGREAQSVQQLKHDLAGWLRRGAAKQPLVILLDDLHWADADSLEVLDYLTSQSDHARILFIATFGSEETYGFQALGDYLPKLRRNRQFDLIHLKPLDREDIGRLVTARLGPCSPQLAAYLHDRAEGHPLFTVELLNDLAAQGVLAQDSNGFWLPPERSIPVPVYLKQLISQRVSRLGSQVEKLLSAAAVTGEVWDLPIVEQLVDITEDELLAALEEALREDLLTIEDEKAEIYRFSHGLIRQVLYAGQLTRRRKRLHEQIASRIEQEQPGNVNAIAYHYYEGEIWVRAADFCLVAGEDANRQFANHSALQWYQQALHASERAGKARNAEAHIAIYDRLGRTHLALGQRLEAENVYKRMRATAQREANLVAEGYALVHLSGVQMRQFKLELAEKTAYEAFVVGQQTSDSRLLTHIHAALGGVALLRGQLDQATHYYDEVFHRAEELGEAGILLDALRQRAYQAIWIGRYSEAKTYARQALELAQKSGDPLVIAGAYQNLGFAQIELGQYREAHRIILTTLEAVEASGAHHHQEPRLLNLMGYLYLELGDAAEALRWDQRALEAIQSDHLQSLEMRRYSLLNIGTDYMHLGRLDKAQDAVAQFENIKEGAEYGHFRYFNRYQLLMCAMHLARRAFEPAVKLAQEARELAQSKGMLKNIAKSHWLEGQALAGTRHFDEALEHIEKAIAIADDIQHGSLRWKIRLSLAGVLAKAGKPSQEAARQARDLIHQTLHSLSSSPLQGVLAASPWIEQLESLHKTPALTKPVYPAGLTQREVEILQLVASGATNQQVADALQISVRTVNTHMTNILNKIGCDNRTAASTFAIQHNLVST